MKFKAIGFDYVGVVYGPLGDIFREKIANLLGISIEEFKKAYQKHNILINTTDISLEDFWKIVLDDLGKLEKLSSLLILIRNHHSKMGINQDILDLVDSLRAKGYKVGLLSNLSSSGAMEIRKSGLEKHFDAFLVSAEIGHMKLEREAFEILAEKLGVKTSELIFIDDTERSLANAKEIGFQPILFTDYENLIKNLSDLGVI